MSDIGKKLTLEFDDIIYTLQRFGGITEFWKALTKGVEARGLFEISRCTTPSWQRLLSPLSEARIFHSSYFRTARGRGVRNVVTVHDMAYELGHAGNSLRNRMGRLERRRAYFAADTIICVSENTRRDLLGLFPTLAGRCPVSVIHNWPTLDADDPGISRQDLASKIDSPYVLMVGKRDDYKNFGGALAGFSASRLADEGLRLVCTGSALSSDETALIERHGLSGRVISLGAIDRPTMVALYRNAHCLLYPSLFEGFGMPVVEAMTLGCPVVAAARTSIPEIAGDAALLVDNAEPEGLANAMRSLGDSETRAEMVAAGRRRAKDFSCARSIDEHVQIYNSLA